MSTSWLRLSERRDYKSATSPLVSTPALALCQNVTHAIFPIPTHVLHLSMGVNMAIYSV